MNLIIDDSGNTISKVASDVGYVVTYIVTAIADAVVDAITNTVHAIVGLLRRLFW